MRNKRAFVSFLVVGALVAVAGVAAADDTIINSGYDEANRLLLLNTTSWEDPESDPECQFDTDLEDEEGTVYELEYTFNDTTEVEDVSVGDAECELQAFDVTGPVGQVNHGTFVSAIATLYDGPHRGCIISHFARSDLGKDDQQINGPQEETETSDTGTVEFDTIVADCEKNGNGKSELADGEGRPDWAGEGRPEWAGQKGGPNAAVKSGSAPGRDR